jgi:hypothetical protein
VKRANAVKKTKENGLVVLVVTRQEEEESYSLAPEMRE